MARERLTSRARQAADDKTPYPGSINQEGREEEGRGSMTYRTFEPSVANHELQDLRRVHGVSDQHNEIGFGVPDPASGMLVASSEYQAKCIKAAELAETFLGPKVSDRMLLAQARDFLVLSDEGLDRTLERFNRTDNLYVAEEAPVEPAPVEESAVEEQEEAAEACMTAEADEEEKEEAEEVAEEAEEVAEDVSGPEAEDEAQEIEQAADEVAEMPAAPAPAAPNDEVDVPSRQIPQMEEGSAASPDAQTPSAGSMDPEAAATKPEGAAPVAVEEEAVEAMYSEERATNLAQLAAATLKPEECTQENIVEQAKKFASLQDDQIKVLLASYGQEYVEAPQAQEEAPAEETAEVASDGEIEVSQAQSLDVGSFDLNEEFNDGPVTATPEEQAELASIFEDQQAPQMPQMSNPQDALTASIAQLAGRSKVASKVGVKSVGNVTLQNNAPAQKSSELESIWDAPADFPMGGF